jgi:hypothetical protein
MPGIDPIYPNSDKPEEKKTHHESRTVRAASNGGTPVRDGKDHEGFLKFSLRSWRAQRFKNSHTKQEFQP